MYTLRFYASIESQYGGKRFYGRSTNTERELFMAPTVASLCVL